MWFTKNRLHAQRYREMKDKVRKLTKKAGGKRGASIVLYVSPDGFIPAVQFSSNSTDELVKLTSWSYSCITGNAEAISGPEPIWQRQGGPNEARWVTERKVPPEVERLMREPTGRLLYPEWSWGQLIQTLSMQLDIDGNAYPQIMQTPDSIALFPHNPTLVTPVAGVKGTLSYYEIGGVKFSPDQICHMMLSTPGSTYQGRSPLQAALRAATIDRTAHERQKANLENKVAPGLVVSVDGYGLNDTQRAAFETYLTDNYQAATKDGKPLVMGANAKLLAPPQTNDQLNYFETRKFSREEILAIFRTPPVLVGDFDKATLQNFEKALRMWWNNALIPRLNVIYDALNRQLIWRKYTSRYRLWYDLAGSEFSLIVLEAKIAIAQKLVDLGYPTNMAAASAGLNMPHVPELDQPNLKLSIAGRADSEPPPNDSTDYDA